VRGAIEAGSNQILRCTVCRQRHFVSRSEWTNPEQKLAAVERFRESHSECQRLVDLGADVRSSPCG
jgi:hypothetical protein